MFGKKKGKTTYTGGDKKITKEENQKLANKSKDKGNNEGVADLRDIKNSEGL